jgi:hypothetical protein
MGISSRFADFSCNRAGTLVPVTSGHTDQTTKLRYWFMLKAIQYTEGVR